MYGEDGKDRAQHEGELPDEETERLMYHRTREILEEYGFTRYEISNYAKPGFACRHNLGYWERAEYLGIGTGAASLIGNQRWNEGEKRLHCPERIRWKSICSGTPEDGRRFKSGIFRDFGCE